MESIDYEAYEDDYFANCTSADQNCTTDLSEPLGTNSLIIKIVVKSLLVVLALIGSICTISLLANTTTKYVLSRYVVTRTLAALLSLLTLSFDLVTDYNGSWIFGYVLCLGKNGLSTIAFPVYSGMQVGMCINTYLEESKSTPNSKLRSTAFKITSFISWSFALAIGFFIFKSSEVLGMQPSLACVFGVGQYFFILHDILTMIMPIIVSWVLLGLAVCHKRTQPAAISLEEPASVSSILQKRSKQLSFAITTSFTIFSLVIAVPILMLNFGVEEHIYDYVIKLFSIIHYLVPVHFIIDLALYPIFLRDAYKHLKKVGLSVDDPLVVPLRDV
ncbi:uncharacterized protein LOC135213247 [Macrobrachium nipponense]|uniref:uncharacterized protein LOC135213247 n=1 Tax=Macrobrachium nipponense TaxID=159736 RepID=UPI0030C84E4C